MRDARPSGATAVGVEVLIGRHTGSGRCVIDGGRAIVDLPGMARRSAAEASPGGVVRQTAIPGAALPEWLAGLLGLGPRPHVASPGVLLLDRTVLDGVVGLVEPDVDAVAAALRPDRPSHPWLELLVAIAAGMSARWCVTVRPVASETGDTLEVIDSADAGLWTVQACPPELVAAETGASGDVVTLAPTTPTAVWAWLSRLAAAD